MTACRFGLHARSVADDRPRRHHPVDGQGAAPRRAGTARSRLPAAGHPDPRPHRGAGPGRGRRLRLGRPQRRWPSAAASAPTRPASSRWRDLLAPLGIEVLGYDLPLWHGEEACLHLMSVISPLADDLALVYSPLLPAAFYQLLKARGIRLVEGDARGVLRQQRAQPQRAADRAAPGDRGRRLPEDRGGDGSGRLHGRRPSRPTRSASPAKAARPA